MHDMEALKDLPSLLWSLTPSLFMAQGPPSVPAPAVLLDIRLQLCHSPALPGHHPQAGILTWPQPVPIPKDLPDRLELCLTLVAFTRPECSSHPQGYISASPHPIPAPTARAMLAPWIRCGTNPGCKSQSCQPQRCLRCSWPSQCPDTWCTETFTHHSTLRATTRKD